MGAKRWTATSKKRCHKLSSGAVQGEEGGCKLGGHVLRRKGTQRGPSAAPQRQRRLSPRGRASECLEARLKGRDLKPVSAANGGGGTKCSPKRKEIVGEVGLGGDDLCEEFQK
jgi:hypothetical protein